MQTLMRCSKCTQDVNQYAVKQATAKQLEEKSDADAKKMVETLQTLKERQKRTIMRKLKSGILDFNAESNQFYYTEDGRALNLDSSMEGSDLDDFSNDSQSDANDDCTDDKQQKEESKENDQDSESNQSDNSLPELVEQKSKI